MRTIVRFMMAASVVAFISCTKESADNQIDNGATIPQVLVSFDVDEPVAEPDTRIVHSESDGVHTIKWKAGDQFSLFGYVSNTDRKFEVLNYSANRYSLVYGNGTKTFKGYVPNVNEIYGANSGVILYQYGIYPATTVEVTGSQPNYTAKPVTPLTIPAQQDGTGWPYAVFFSRTSVLGGGMNPAAGDGLTFSLKCVMLRLKVESEKPVVSLTVTTDAPVLVGDVSTIACSATGMWISTGCATQKLTVSNGSELPNDLYFAVRDLRKDCTYTFEFTAEDGSKFTRSLKASRKYEHEVLSLTVKPEWKAAQ